jgi:hypothetical protein
MQGSHITLPLSASPTTAVRFRILPMSHQALCSNSRSLRALPRRRRLPPPLPAKMITRRMLLMKAERVPRVLLELARPWHHSGSLLIGNTYFASIKAALMAKDVGFFFIGNVKQCSRRFPMEVLGNATLPTRGSQSVLALISDETGKTELVAIAWVNHNRCFFVATMCGLGAGRDNSAQAPPPA